MLTIVYTPSPTLLILYRNGDFAATEVLAFGSEAHLRRYVQRLPENATAIQVRNVETLRHVPKAVLLILLRRTVAGKVDTQLSRTSGNLAQQLMPRLSALARNVPHDATQEKAMVNPDARKIAAAKKTDAKKPLSEKTSAKSGPAKKTVPKTKSVTNGVKGKRLGIGKFMGERLQAGDSTEKVLAAVHKKFPASTAKAGDVTIIRRKIGMAAPAK